MRIFITILICLFALSAQASDVLKWGGEVPEPQAEDTAYWVVIDGRGMTAEDLMAVTASDAHILGDTFTLLPSNTNLTSSRPSYSDIEKALTLALQYLKPSTYLESTNAIYRTRATELRLEADRLDQMDKDIKYIEAILRELR